MADRSGVEQISFTPLYGAGPDEPFCGLLQIESLRILIDCGWDERWDESLLEPLKQAIGDGIDAVLISFPDLAHLGALPYAIGKLGLSAPIYATIPVCKMGQMFMYDAFQARYKFGLDAFTIDDVDTVFDRFEQLRPQQEVKLTGNDANSVTVTVTPSRAGHMLGGTVWRITKETEEILYATRYNQARERHLDGTPLDSLVSRPTIMITDASNALLSLPPRKQRDQELHSTVLARVREGGCVLLPVDAAGRVLELALLLHEQWERLKLGRQTYPLVFLSPNSQHTLEFARSQLEWMGSAVRKQFETVRDHPYQLRSLHVCQTRAQLDALPKPYVVMATSHTLETSLAQDLMVDLAADPRNFILFTNRAPEWSLAAQMMQTPTPKQVTFNRRRVVYLEGEELERYQEQKKLERDRSELEEKPDLESDAEDEDMDDVVDVVGARRRLTTPFPMFPAVEYKRNWDVMGEVINPIEYTTVAALPGAVPIKQEQKSDKMDTAEDDQPKAARDERPSRYVTEPCTVYVACKVHFIDFEGRSDGRSIKKILSQVKPRKLILIHGSDKCKQELQNFCAKNVPDCKEVFVPKSNQCIDVTSETNIFKVNLKETLLQTIQFVQVGEYEVGYAESRVKIDFHESALPVLEAPSHSTGHPAVFLGEAKLSDVREVLLDNGFQAEFFGGILVCAGGAINIRKVAPTQLSIQGGLCDEYFRVRELLYKQYQIV